MLTRQHSGLFYDPNKSGDGFEIHFFSRNLAEPVSQVMISAFLGHVPGHAEHAIWYSAQGPVDFLAGRNIIPLYEARERFAGESRPPVGIQVGTLTIEDVTSASMLITLDIVGDGAPVFSPGEPPKPVRLVFNVIRQPLGDARE